MATAVGECWNHPPLFEYVDRWWQEEQQANAFVTAMWQKYRQRDVTGKSGGSRCPPR
jgi:hypothetical protein